jgi:hypothetical protein
VQLLAFAKACERKGRAEAVEMLRKLERHYDSKPAGIRQEWSAAASGALSAVADVLDELNKQGDAELAPIREAEEARFMTAAGYVRGKRWVLPEHAPDTGE